MTITLKLFQSSINKLFPSSAKCLPKNIAIALSGGPDSMLLAWLFTKYKNSLSQSRDLNIHAITIDHDYRPESASEALSLTKCMNRWGINHIIKKIDYEVDDPKTITNFEEVARTKRYDLMNQICNELDIPVLFLGHHRDDQLETFVQRLQGNSSIFGLAGTRMTAIMPLARDLTPLELSKYKKVRLMRPLLGFDKGDILETCQENQIPVIIDPTNLDINLTKRNYLRNLFGEILPNKCNEFKVKNGNTTSFPYESIMKKELINTQQVCINLVDSLEEKAHNLYLWLVGANLFHEYPSFSRLLIELPKKCFEGSNKFITSRFLYQKLYPYSTLKHYHWAYTKLERQLIPKIDHWLRSNPTNAFKCTMMNLKFEVSTKNSSIVMDINKTPLTRSELIKVERVVQITNGWSEWILFDKRFWLRFKLKKKNHTTIKIIPYFHKSHHSMIDKSLSEQFEFDGRLNSLPVIINNDKIIALPTSNSHIDDIDCEWQLKYNKFDYNKK
ncbi:hypothetical protein KGF54_000535 [Candida jiufengensis]|uniref:uncharacterized protein n=1 Tax=Candida jiufengensis TaxID=497108 RepID=UPI0022242055|nr:uncharacterized protein KGF54_000535 [Candida jiufengensis]KAI5956916.1 hypothetical protein KGF54_000535 [Candida jiufengensis]